jgi:hypothetical protein
VKKWDSWRIKEFFWWFRIYRQRILWSYVAISLVLAAIAGAYVYSRPETEEPPSQSETVAKLEKCTSFVYDLLKANTKCVGTLQECGQALEQCTEKLEQFMNDPNYRREGD